MNMLIIMKVNVWFGDVVEVRVQSAEEERGRLLRAVMSTVGMHKRKGDLCQI